jgi:hypothetical protein
LRNKTTKDCIRFYYDSKQAVPYKSALREHHLRRKRRGVTWEGTFEAAVSVGAIVKAGVNELKPLVFLLPESDNTYRTRQFHPMKREVFDSLVMDQTSLITPDMQDAESDETQPSKRRCLRRPVFTPSEEQSRFLQAQEADVAEVRTDDEVIREEATPIRRPRQKWSAEEKSVFVEILETQPSQSRPDWKLFSEALRSKSLEQIKNFYYDYKKPTGRNRGERKKARRQDETSTPTPMTQTDPTPAASAIEPVALAASTSIVEPAPQYGVGLPFHPIQHQPHQPRHSNPYGDLYCNEMSRTSTPDPVELAWTQQLLMGQGGEAAARRLLQSHHQQQQQQQQHHLLSSLISWPHGDWNEQHQHQQLFLRLQQQQQTNQQLAALGLGSYRQDDAQLALAQHLLNLQSRNGNFHGNSHPPRGPR